MALDTDREETVARSSDFAPTSASTLHPMIRRVSLWGALFAAAAVGTSYVAFVIYWTWQEEGWVKQIIQQHFAACLGLPLMGVAAFLLVQVLQVSAGKIEFEAWGLKLRGASGPVALWAVCFLAIAIATKLLW